MQKKIVYCRYAPSLGELEDTAENIWGTKEYEGDLDEPCIFFGLYGLPDFYSLWRHKGKKWILWTGSDIRHFEKGYWLEDGGNIFLPYKPLATWINKYCESWVENEVEYSVLKRLGIESKICPSFLGNVDDYEISYKPSIKPKVYASISGDDFKLYCWDEFVNLADKNPLIEFHLYGNSRPFGYVRETNYQNIVIHGRVPKEVMNAEIKEMQGALRLLPFEGFSEIIAKSVLWGQWPISAISYPYMLSPEELGTLKDKKKPNLKGRNYYLAHLNKFPWNLK